MVPHNLRHHKAIIVNTLKSDSSSAIFTTFAISHSCVILHRYFDKYRKDSTTSFQPNIIQKISHVHPKNKKEKKKHPFSRRLTHVWPFPSPPVPLLLPRRKGVFPGRHAAEIHALEAGALRLHRVAIVAGPGMSWMAKQQGVQHSRLGI